MIIFAQVRLETFFAQMYIGVISDTHGFFDKPVRDFLAPVDELWHAGDIGGGLELASELADFKPLVAVCGNMDDRRLLDTHPLFESFTREGLGILMTHIGGYPGRYNPEALRRIDREHPDIFVCGHSHILKVVNDPKRRMLCINPGAAGVQGFHIVSTALRFHIDNGVIHDMEVFEIEKNRRK